MSKFTLSLIVISKDNEIFYRIFLIIIIIIKIIMYI